MIKAGKNVPVLQEAVEKFALMLIKSKREGGLLSFNDVSDLAVNILRDNKTIREYYKNKYCYIMIDEFQDNNSKQRDLLFLLAEKKDICNTGCIPTIDELEEEKLFFVGDDKQSIYRFRGADVSVFRRLQEEIAVNGNALTLRKNYRSQSKLINHFNDVFSTVFTTSSTGADYEAQYNPIETGRKEDNTQSKIVFAVYDKDEIKKEEDDIGAFEAELVGSYCDRVLNTDEFLVNGKRPNPEDIAILFKSSSNQMNIEKALKKRGINYQIAETRSLMLDAVSNDFYCFINYLLYPNDKRSYYSLLKGPFCGLCEQSIINLNQDLDVLEVDQKRYKAFSLFFEQVKSQAFRLTIPQLLEMLYIQGGYKAYLDSSSDNQSFIEHYDYLYSYAIQYQDEGRGLGDFARFIRSYLGDNQKLPDVSVLHSEKSGVQIMSVHKSKGLEFKVVIYTGIGNNGKRDIKDCVFDYNNSIIATEETSIQDLLDEDKKAKETAELKRVMYVAFTRAMDHLITIGGYNLTKEKEYNKKDTSDVLIWYCKAIGYDNENHIAANKAVTVDYIIQAPTTKAKKISREEKALQESLSAFVSSPNRVSVTALKAKEEYSVSNIVSLPNYPIDELLIENNLQDKFGTLCHFTLESLLTTGTYDAVKCTIFESDKANNLALNQAKAFADSFGNSDFYKQNIAEKDSLQELRFYTSDKQNNGLAIEGVIDLLVFGDDFNLVVDYKTDSYKNPEGHKIQVLTYIKAAQEIYNKKCYGTLFYLRDASTSPIWEEDGNEISIKDGLIK